VSPPAEKITRKVLITVNNGKENDPVPAIDDHNNNYGYKHHRSRSMGNPESTFVVGELEKPPKMCTSSSFRLGMSARKRHLNNTRYFKHHNDDGWSHNGNAVDDDQDIDRKRAAQEAARRERWKRGIEMEKRMYKNSKERNSGRYNHKDDDSTDSFTQGSHTTGTSMTGYDTTEDSSSTDDWTDATEEESRLVHNKHYYHRNHRRHSSSGQCSNGKLTESLGEDLGIFAQLILSDGYACLGTAAEITKETVVGCRDGNP